MKEPFTQIPNRLIESRNADIYDKAIFMVIARYHPSFPSYTHIGKLLGISRERVWKSLRNLERLGAIQRFRKGKSIFYETYTSSPGEPHQFARRTAPVRQANRTSSPGEPIPVRQANSNKTKNKTNLISEEDFFDVSENPTPKELTFSEIVLLAKQKASGE